MDKNYATLEESSFVDFWKSGNVCAESVCRICLAVCSDELYRLDINYEDGLLSQMFTYFTSITVNQNDGLPYQICEACKLQILNCYKFKLKCVQSHETLISIFSVDSCKKTSQVDVFHHEAIHNKIKLEFQEDVQYLEDGFDSDEIERIDSPTLYEQKLSNEDKEQQAISTKLKLIDTNQESMIEDQPKKSKSKTCGFCDKKFRSVKARMDHVKRKHFKEPTIMEEVPNSCFLCGTAMSSEHDLKLHLTLHKQPPWNCLDCDKEFKEIVPYRRHIKRHMDIKRYSCDSCDKTFTELYALRRHTRVHTGERPLKKFQCDICDKRYTHRAQLLDHIKSHDSSSARLVCSQCGKLFRTQRLLTSHLRVHSDEKRFECHYCGKRFRHDTSLKTHHRTHTGEKPYVCSECGLCFIQSSNLTLHMRTHSGARPYKCPTCGEQFSSSSTLKNHRRRHSGDKPYACTICNKTFSRKALRKNHMYQHSGERPFACDACPRRFTRPVSLREHQRLHTGEKPFECAICEHKFTTKTLLIRHVKMHQEKKRKPKKETAREVLFLTPENQQSYVVIRHDNEAKIEQLKELTESEIPLEVTGELVLQNDGTKADLVLLEDGQTHGTICLANGVNFVNNDVNLVTVNEGEVSISASTAMMEGTTVKLYQLDQSLVQIQSVAGQVTISKVTSKMTANF